MAEKFLRVIVDSHMTIKFPCREGGGNGPLKSFLVARNSLTQLIGKGMVCAVEQESLPQWKGEVASLNPKNGEVTVQILQRGGK